MCRLLGRVVRKGSNFDPDYKARITRVCNERVLVFIHCLLAASGAAAKSVEFNSGLIVARRSLKHKLSIQTATTIR
jgi:hypothetical protein